MREVASLIAMDSEAKQFFWGTVQSWVRKETIFESIWQSMDVEDETAYRIG
jgi:hypothetical protein